MTHVKSASAALRSSISGVCANVASEETGAQKRTTTVRTPGSQRTFRNDDTPYANAATIPEAATASKQASANVRTAGNGTATPFGRWSDTFAAAGNCVSMRRRSARSAANEASAVMAATTA